MNESKKPATRIYRLRRRDDQTDVTLIESHSQTAALLKFADAQVAIDVPSALDVAKHVRDGAEVIAS